MLHSDDGRVASLRVARQDGGLGVVAIEFGTSHLAVGDLAESAWLVRIVLWLRRNAILAAGVELVILNLVLLAAIFRPLHLLYGLI